MNKRILFVSHELTYTGAPTSLLQMCEAARRLGYQVNIWSKMAGGFNVEFAKRGFRVKIVPESALEDEKVKRELQNFDLALCNTIATEKYANALEKHLPTIWMIREALGAENYLKKSPVRAELMRTTRHLCCVSEYARSVLSRHRTLPIHVLHNCVEDVAGEVQLHIPGQGQKIKFGHFARIQEKKGYDELIKAFLSLPPQYQERCELYISGQKYENEFCKKIFQTIEKTDNIHYLGYLKGIDYLQKMAEMDVVVVASRDESCSLVVLEASMLGRPLIITENVGAKYMVSSDSGMVAKTNHPESLSQAMMDMMNHSDGLKEFGEKARSNYEKYAGIDYYDRQMKDLFEKVVADESVQQKRGFRGYPLVSLIVPVYNTGTYLRDCLDSIIDQSMDHLEIICIDDRSTDDSWDILNSYAERDTRFILYRNPRNIGASPTRNIGLQIASGKYVMFLDSDDLYDKELIEKLIREAEMQESDVTMCGYARFKDTPKKVFVGRTSLEIAEKFPSGYNVRSLPDHIFQVGNIGPTTKLYQRAFLLDNDLSFQNLKNSNDIYFGGMCFALANKVVYIPDVLVFYREHDNQITNTRSVYRYEAYKALRKFHRKLVSANIWGICYKSYVCKVMDLLMYQYNCCLEKDKDGFMKFWKEKGFADCGMENCDASDFQHEYMYKFYRKVMSLPDEGWKKIPSWGIEPPGVVKNITWQKDGLIFPFHLFPPDSKVFLYGNKDICQAFSNQVKDLGADVNIIGSSFAKEDKVQLRTAVFQYVLICEMDREIADKLKSQLLSMGIEEERIIWDDKYSIRDFFQQLYFPLVTRMGAMLPWDKE